MHPSPPHPVEHSHGHKRKLSELFIHNSSSDDDNNDNNDLDVVINRHHTATQNNKKQKYHNGDLNDNGDDMMMGTVCGDNDNDDDDHESDDDEIAIVRHRRGLKHSHSVVEGDKNTMSPTSDLSYDTVVVGGDHHDESHGAAPPHKSDRDHDLLKNQEQQTKTTHYHVQLPKTRETEAPITISITNNKQSYATAGPSVNRPQPPPFTNKHYDDETLDNRDTVRVNRYHNGDARENETMRRRMTRERSTRGGMDSNDDEDRMSNRYSHSYMSRGFDSRPPVHGRHSYPPTMMAPPSSSSFYYDYNRNHDNAFHFNSATSAADADRRRRRSRVLSTDDRNRYDRRASSTPRDAYYRRNEENERNSYNHDLPSMSTLSSIIAQRQIIQMEKQKLRAFSKKQNARLNRRLSLLDDAMVSAQNSNLDTDRSSRNISPIRSQSSSSSHDRRKQARLSRRSASTSAVESSETSVIPSRISPPLVVEQEETKMDEVHDEQKSWTLSKLALIVLLILLTLGGSALLFFDRTPGVENYASKFAAQVPSYSSRVQQMFRHSKESALPSEWKQQGFQTKDTTIEVAVEEVIREAREAAEEAIGQEEEQTKNEVIQEEHATKEEEEHLPTGDDQQAEMASSLSDLL